MIHIIDRCIKKINKSFKGYSNEFNFLKMKDFKHYIQMKKILY